MPPPASYDTSKVLPNTNPLSSVATGLHPFWPIEVVFALNKAYLFQQGETPRVFDGSALKTISGISPSQFSAAAVTPSASGFTGDYLYTCVYFDPDDEELCTTGPYADTALDYLYVHVTPNAEDVDCTIHDPPASQTRLTRARVFRSVGPTLSTDMRALTGNSTYADVTVVPGAAGTHTFTDDGQITDNELSRFDPLSLKKRTASEGLPPAGYTADFFEGRMWMPDPDNRNVALYSESNLPQDFPTRNRVTLLPSIGDPNPEIQKVIVNNGGLWLYTKNAGYNITGSGPPFIVRAFFRGVGTISAGATKYVEGVGVIFPSNDGVYVHAGGSEVTRIGVPRGWPGTNPLGDYWENIEAANYGNMSALVDHEKNLIHISAPLNQGDAVCTGGFDLDVTRLNWSRYTNRVVSCYGKWVDYSGREWPVFGDELGQVWQMDLGTAEGAFGNNLTFTALNGTTTSVEGPSAPDPPLSPGIGTPGVPILVRDPDTGEVIGETRSLAYNDPTLEFLWPLDAAPADGDLMAGGCIKAAWQSGWIQIVKGFWRGAIHYIDVQMQIEDANGDIRVAYGVDQNTDLVTVTQAMDATQQFDRLAANDRGNWVSVLFEGTDPGVTFGVLGWMVEATAKPYRR